MFHEKTLRYYLFLFLAFAVLSSKNIFIYNEETLVALSFFCFIYFVIHYFGMSIQNSLDERSQQILEELQNFLWIKETSLQKLQEQHENTSKLVKILNVLENFTQTQVDLLTKTSEKALKNLWNSRIDEKLKRVAFSKMTLQQKLQELLAERIRSTILVAFPKKGKGFAKLQAYKTRTLKKSVASLAAEKERKNLRI